VEGLPERSEYGFFLPPDQRAHRAHLHVEPLFPQDAHGFPNRRPNGGLTQGIETDLSRNLCHSLLLTAPPTAPTPAAALATDRGAWNTGWERSRSLPFLLFQEHVYHPGEDLPAYEGQGRPQRGQDARRRPGARGDGPSRRRDGLPHLLHGENRPIRACLQTRLAFPAERCLNRRNAFHQPDRAGRTDLQAATTTRTQLLVYLHQEPSPRFSAKRTILSHTSARARETGPSACSVTVRPCTIASVTTTS